MLSPKEESEMKRLSAGLSGYKPRVHRDLSDDEYAVVHAKLCGKTRSEESKRREQDAVARGDVSVMIGLDGKKYMQR